MELAQKLISSRRGSLWVSLGAALLAGVVILVYVNGYRNNLRAGSTPVTVLVARQTIAKGTAGNVIASKDLYTATTIRESQLREGAYSDPASLTDKVAAKQIYKGAQLTATDFAAGSSDLSSTLSDHQRIISVPLDSAHGLSGDVQEGDHVDVYGAFNVVRMNPDGTPVAGGLAVNVVRLIAQNVEVVRLGSTTGIASATKTSNVGLKVSDDVASKIAYTVDNGKVWLTLRPAAGAKPSANQVVNVQTVALGIPPIVVLHQLGGRR